MKESDRKKFHGTLAVGYTVLLLGSASLAPSAWIFVENHIAWHNQFPKLLALLAILPMSFFLRDSARILFFLVSVGLFFYAMTRLERAIEQIHFIEYGLLSYFLYRFFKHFLKSPWDFIGSVAGAFGIGVVDELFQGLLPNRFCDPRDLLINFWSAGLGMLVVASVTPRPL